jgi:hypothetical protein
MGAVAFESLSGEAFDALPFREKVEVFVAASRQHPDPEVRAAAAEWLNQTNAALERNPLLVPAISSDWLREKMVYVGIDPGISRGGVVWAAFDNENAMVCFDELYPEGLTVPRDRGADHGQERPVGHRAGPRPWPGGSVLPGDAAPRGDSGERVRDGDGRTGVQPRWPDPPVVRHRSGRRCARDDAVGVGQRPVPAGGDRGDGGQQ